jgi:hypothetical protein
VALRELTRRRSERCEQRGDVIQMALEQFFIEHQLSGSAACVVPDVATLRLPLIRCPTRFLTVSMARKPGSFGRSVRNAVIFSLENAAL